jgi:uncharacterized membrane protein
MIMMYQRISILGFILFGVLFIVSVFLFIRLDILLVVGELTGSRAKRQIRAIRESNNQIDQLKTQFLKGDLIETEVLQVKDVKIKRKRRRVY